MIFLGPQESQAVPETDARVERGRTDVKRHFTIYACLPYFLFPLKPISNLLSFRPLLAKRPNLLANSVHKGLHRIYSPCLTELRFRNSKRSAICKKRIIKMASLSYDVTLKLRQPVVHWECSSVPG